MLSPNTDHKLDHLLNLAELGHALFRLPQGEKSPAEGGPGLNSATCIPQLIEALHRDQPEANWGLVVKHLVIDLDSYKITQQALPPWPATTERAMELAGAGAVSITRNGGRQYHFAIPEGKNWTSGAGQIHPAVDVRAAGTGYVVVSPSFVPPDPGTGGDGHYRWVDGCELTEPSEKLPLPPQWLIDLVDKHHSKGPAKRESKPHNPRRAENWPDLLSGAISFANTNPPDIARALELVLSSGSGATIDEQLEDGTTHLRCNQKKAGLSATWDAPEDRGPDDGPRLRVRGGSWPRLMEAGARHFKFSVWDILLAFEDGAEERLRADYLAALEASTEGWDVDEFLRSCSGEKDEYHTDDDAGVPGGRLETPPGWVNLWDVEVEPVNFVVPGLFIAGLNVISADPGTGKSSFGRQISADLALGTGRFAHPDGPVSVGWLLTEDPRGSVILPELVGMGLRTPELMARVPMLQKPATAGAEGLKIVQDVLKARPDIRVLVIDPLQSFLSGGNLNSANPDDVRKALDPYHRLGMERGVAIVALGHLKKDPNVQGQGRMSGSHQQSATARVVYLAERDGNTTHLRLEKYNQQGHLRCLAFTRVELQGTELEDAIRSMGDRWKPEWPTQTIGRLEWRDAPEEAPPKKQVDPVDEARLVIAAHLDIQSDWLSLASLKSHCRGQDLSERAIDAARKALVGDELVVETTVLGRPADGKYLASSQHAEAWGRPQGPAEPATGDEMMF